MDDRAKKLAFLEVLRTFIESVKAAGSLGAPAGVMYAAVMGAMTLDQFETVMSALVQAGKIRKSGDLYFHVADL